MSKAFWNLITPLHDVRVCRIPYPYSLIALLPFNLAMVRNNVMTMRVLKAIINVQSTNAMESENKVHSTCSAV